MSDFYENLLRATNNLDDITTEKYGTITSKKGNYCTVKETDNDLEHTNVPILNGAELNVGDKVIIGFLNNSIYDVICYGAIGKTIHDTTKQDTLQSGVNIKTINHQSLLGSGNIDIQGGGGGGSIVMVGSFEIDNNGHLIATIPDGASNPYHIDFSTGHLIYDTSAGDT
jgi:hypothetical protein